MKQYVDKGEQLRRCLNKRDELWKENKELRKTIVEKLDIIIKLKKEFDEQIDSTCFIDLDLKKLKKFHNKNIKDKVLKKYWIRLNEINVLDLLGNIEYIIKAYENQKKKEIDETNLLGKSNHILGCNLEAYADVLRYRGYEGEATMLDKAASRIK